MIHWCSKYSTSFITSCICGFISGKRLMNLTYEESSIPRVLAEHKWYLEWSNWNWTSGLGMGDTMQWHSHEPHTIRRLPGSSITSYEVAKLSQDIASHFHHILMTGWSLQCLYSTRNNNNYYNFSIVAMCLLVPRSKSLQHSPGHLVCWWWSEWFYTTPLHPRSHRPIGWGSGWYPHTIWNQWQTSQPK